MRALLILFIGVATACSDPPTSNMGDAGSDSGLDVSRDVADPGADTADSSVPDMSGTFDCYETTCKIGKEYCPGRFCSGDPMPDAGGCPQGCQPCMTGAGLEFCNCTQTTCEPLPENCNSCDCIETEVGCQCTQDEDGALRVECLSA